MPSFHAPGDTKRRLLQLPLLRRDSMGPSYHVLTFDAGEDVVAGAGQFAMVRGAAWGQAPLLPRPMSLLESGRRPSILIKIVGEGSRRLAHASPGEPFDLLLPLGNRWSPCPPGHTPILVAGGAATGLKGGRHIRYEKGTNLANLHLTLLDRVGIHLDSFMDSSGKVEDLFDRVDVG